MLKIGTELDVAALNATFRPNRQWEYAFICDEYGSYRHLVEAGFLEKGKRVPEVHFPVHTNELEKFRAEDSQD